MHLMLYYNYNSKLWIRQDCHEKSAIDASPNIDIQPPEMTYDIATVTITLPHRHYPLISPPYRTPSKLLQTLVKEIQLL